ncbi:hypothetical protein GGI17_003906 [Coemansia sp. S146]|nr:hypothetical protein GGI17_003906 [Coemansia sp. S146]
MRTVSAFQLLPNHVIERIVDHVTDSSRLLFDGVKPNSNEYRTMLRPLLSVCHGFRAIALTRYCNLCKLELASRDTFRKVSSDVSKRASVYASRNDHYNSSDPHEFGYHLLGSLSHPTHHLAKELIVELDKGDIYSGEALRMLTHAPYEGCAFPLARKLIIRIFMDITDEDHEGHLINLSYKRRMKKQSIDTNRPDSFYDSNEDDHVIRPNVDTTTDPSVLEANIGAFAQRINEECTSLYGSLVTQLFQLSKHITYNEYDATSVPLELQPNQICDLVHISFDIDFDTNPFVQLAQRSALTLQSLSIGPNSFVGPDNFFEEPGGGHLAYPRLLSLKLLGMHRVGNGEYPSFPGAVPFPNLQHLDMEVCYPFSDDTLFRGNAATLEYLKIELDDHSCPVFCEYDVFTPGSHPKLRCVDITFSDEVMPYPDADTAECLEYVLNIGSQASVRTIRGYVDDSELVQTLYLFEDFACIKVLSLPGLRWLDFWDISDLIKSLPLLSDLTTSPPILKPTPIDSTTDDFPAFIIKSFATLSEQFRCWSFMQTGVSDGVVKYVLFLALVCPNFSYAVPLPADRKEFVELMEENMNTDCFQEYAPLAMQFLSAFQLLPPHIVKLIVDHVAFSSRLVYEGSDDDEMGRGIQTTLQVPLLGFDAWAAYSGKALAQMSMVPFEGCPFPQVRELKITLYINLKEKDDDDGDEYPSVVSEDYPLETTANTAAFVQRLKQMTPGVDKVKVDVLLHDMEEIWLEDCSVHDMELACQLYSIADTLVAITQCYDQLVMYMDLEPIRGLVRIDIDIDGCTKKIVAMVRRNIQTLQVLAVSVSGLASITGLIQNTGVGDYLEYPCLHTLKLYEFSGAGARKRPAFPGAVPFPNLRSLTLESSYPFSDNVTFRGNAASLVYLNMEMDLSSLTIISNHDVFTPGSHPKLQ